MFFFDVWKFPFFVSHKAKIKFNIDAEEDLFFQPTTKKLPEAQISNEFNNQKNTQRGATASCVKTWFGDRKKFP